MMAVMSEAKEMPPLARALRMALKESGMNGVQLAERLGWTPSRVSTYLTKRAPGYREVAAMERAMRLPAGWVIRHIPEYFDESVDIASFFENDGTISEDTKALLLKIYRDGQQTYKKRTPSIVRSARVG